VDELVKLGLIRNEEHNLVLTDAGELVLLQFFHLSGSVPSSATLKRIHMSKNFERWKELATLTSKEQDPAKLTELATEMNLVLNQKTQNLDPPSGKDSTHL
jgi:hypothetical protein